MIATLYTSDLDTHYVGMVLTSKGTVDLVGRGGINFPRGYLDIAVYDKTGTAIITTAPTDVCVIAFITKDVPTDPFTGAHRILRVTGVDTLSGHIWRFHYEVDYLRDYLYFAKAHNSATSSINNLLGCWITATNDKNKWDRWQYVKLPTDGRKSVVATPGASISRTSGYQGYAVVLKQRAMGTWLTTPPKSVFFVTATDLNYLYGALLQADNEGGGVYVAKSVAAIDGIYFIPGLRLDYNLQPQNMDNVTVTNGYPIIEIEGGTQINISTCKAPTSADRLWKHVEQTGDATLTFDASLSISLDDFRDIYYKSYRVYAPYIGTFDVPIAQLAPYSANGNDTVSIELDYKFNLYEGTVSMEYHGLYGLHPSGYKALPTIPLVASTIGTTYYESAAKLDLAKINGVINAATGGLIAAGTGNVPTGILGIAAMTREVVSAAANGEIANNTAKARALEYSSAANYEGYADNTFYLITEEMLFSSNFTFANYMVRHGYPCSIPCESYTYTAGDKLWIDATDFHPIGGLSTIPHSEWYPAGIINDIESGYVFPED